jgi:GxxExxY protein
MRKAGLAFRRQVVMPVIYDGRVFPRAFVVDLIVAEQILVELKSVETILPVHDKQVITYLRLSGLKQAFLFNFKKRSAEEWAEELSGQSTEVVTSYLY